MEDGERMTADFSSLSRSGGRGNRGEDMRTLRRFLVLLVLMFWQGGFTFYTAVVVPTGTAVLESALAQGWITRQVTVYLNLAGAAALVMLGWDMLACLDPCARRRVLRWLVWCLLGACLVSLVWLHGRLDALMDPVHKVIDSHARFRPLHRWYLWISTCQWACGLAALFLMLQAWRAEEATLVRRCPA